MISARKSADDRADLTPCTGFTDNSVEVILLRLPTVMRITGLARSTIHKLIAQNRFPAPITLSTRAVAWLQCKHPTALAPASKPTPADLAQKGRHQEAASRGAHARRR
jgi:prophage regulatory protein